MAKSFYLTVLGSIIAMFWLAGSPRAQTGGSTALTGAITSTEEGPMDGVIVSAKKKGSTVTVSVVSDAKGRYNFPGGRLDAGTYAVSMRATGYELDNPGPVEIAAGKATEL